MKAPRHHDDYPEQVLAILREHFTLDSVDEKVVVNALTAHRQRPRTGLEVIVDSPWVAHWRLTPDVNDISRVRLGDYRLPGTTGPLPADPREVAVNAALAALT